MEGLEEAMDRHLHDHRVPPHEMHARVKEMYRWEDVAVRTEKVCGRRVVAVLYGLIIKAHVMW